jgi:site-specific DNA-methyltransferase (adenine-specific)
MDATFGPVNFRNEIIWQRALAKGLASRALPNNHDVILSYQKTPAAFYNASELYQPYDEANLDPKTAGKYRHRDESGRRYRLDNLINPNPDRPNLTYEFLGITRVWRWTKQRMQQAYDAGLIVQSAPGRVPQFKRYLDEQRGRPLSDVWTDIPPINPMAQERLGYPTQKPEALVERIIKASSDEGHVVLDPFCGCGTAIVVAQRLHRSWIGIDITHLAITLIKHRLHDAFGGEATYEVVGEPVSLPDAKALAEQDPFQFQWWALGLVGARPVEQKKGSDKGIDGRLYFHDEANVETKQVILSVKAGHTSVAHIHELRGVMEREQAQIGVLITMHQPSQPMSGEAASAGFYKSPGWGTTHPRLQILTVEELLEGKKIDMPAVGQHRATFKQAPKAKGEGPQQLSLED